MDQQQPLHTRGLLDYARKKNIVVHSTRAHIEWKNTKRGRRHIGGDTTWKKKKKKDVVYRGGIFHRVTKQMTISNEEEEI